MLARLWSGLQKPDIAIIEVSVVVFQEMNIGVAV